MSEQPTGPAPSAAQAVPTTEADAAAAFVEEILSRIGSGTEGRVATVTGLEGSGDYRVHLDILGADYWAASLDSSLRVDDRVWVIKNGSTYIVQGRLNGGGGGTPIGSLTAFAGATVPGSWLLCDGSAVSRTDYASLFAVIGTTYGAGNGSTTFNLPNLANRFPLGTGSRGRGATGGAESVTLNGSQVPSHTHSFSGSGSGSTTTGGSAPGTGTATVQSGTGATVAATGSHSHSVTLGFGISGTTGSSGGDGSHENMPPFQVVQWIVKAR